MGPEERITYYSNNFGYSHLNPSSHNGVTHRVNSLEVKNNINSNNNLPSTNANQTVEINYRTPSLGSQSNTNDTPLRLKYPLPPKIMRINGVDVQVNNQARNLS